jgi:DNA (cytosine-5)-methyltransferase 1
MADHHPTWTARRPATTVLADPRISAPSARYRDPDWEPGDPYPPQMRNAVRITVAQAAALQGFRPGYPWQGSQGQCFLQIGNAVCPPLVRLVVEEVARHSLREGEDGV